MKRIPIQSDQKTSFLITDGTVTDSTQVNVVGRWSTNDQAQIVVKLDSGDTSTLDVTWAFNDKNQLVLSQDGVELVTFAGADAQPRFYLDKNILQVDPDGDGDFEFALPGVWGLDEDGTLLLTIGESTSRLDGFIEDSRSRFRFRFFDQDTEVLANTLVFTGTWERLEDEDHKLVLRFRLDDADLENADHPLVLPGEVKVDPKRNHLLFTYQSTSYGSRSLAFQGSLVIKPDWTLSFTIRDFLDGTTGVRKSRIDVATTFDWDAVQGGLELFVGRETAGTGQKLQLGGKLQARIGTKGLDWTFSYLKDTTGAKPVVTLATAARFTWDNGAILLSYQRAGQTTRVDITAKVKTKDFVVEGGVALINDPSGRRLGGFLGVRW